MMRLSLLCVVGTVVLVDALAAQSLAPPGVGRPAIPDVGTPRAKPWTPPGKGNPPNPKRPKPPTPVRTRFGLAKHIETVLFQAYFPHVRQVAVHLDMPRGVVVVGVQLRYFLPSAQARIRRTLEELPELADLQVILLVDLD